MIVCGAMISVCDGILCYVDLLFLPFSFPGGGALTCEALTKIPRALTSVWTNHTPRVTLIYIPFSPVPSLSFSNESFVISSRNIFFMFKIIISKKCCSNYCYYYCDYIFLCCFFAVT